MRRSGNTTRLIDRCVQQLFDQGFTFIYEGRGEENQWQMTVEAYHRMCARLRNEHKGLKYKVIDDIFDGIRCYKFILTE